MGEDDVILKLGADLQGITDAVAEVQRLVAEAAKSFNLIRDESVPALSQAQAAVEGMVAEFVKLRDQLDPTTSQYKILDELIRALPEQLAALAAEGQRVGETLPVAAKQAADAIASTGQAAAEAGQQIGDVIPQAAQEATEALAKTAQAGTQIGETIPQAAADATKAIDATTDAGQKMADVLPDAAKDTATAIDAATAAGQQMADVLPTAAQQTAGALTSAADAGQQLGSVVPSAADDAAAALSGIADAGEKVDTALRDAINTSMGIGEMAKSAYESAAAFEDLFGKIDEAARKNIDDIGTEFGEKLRQNTLSSYDKLIDDIGQRQEAVLARLGEVPDGLADEWEESKNKVVAYFDDLRAAAEKYTGDAVRDAEQRGIKTKAVLEKELDTEKRVLANMLAAREKFTDSAIQLQERRVQSAMAALKSEEQQTTSLFDNLFLKIASGVAAGNLVASAAQEIFTRLTSAIKGAVDAIPDLVEHIAELGDHFLTLSQQTSVSVEALSEWAFVSSQTGVALETMARGTFEMSKRLESGGATVASALDKIKLSAKELKTEKPEEAFQKILEGLGELPNAAERASVGTTLLGSRFRQFAQLTQEDIGKLRTQARALGLTMTEEAARMGDAFKDAQDVIAKTFDGFKQRIATSLLPAATALLQGIGDSLQKFFSSLPFNDASFLDGATQAVEQLIPAFDALLESLKPLSEALMRLVEVGLKVLPDIMSAAGLAVRGFAAVIDGVSYAAGGLADSFAVTKDALIDNPSLENILTNLGSIATILGTVIASLGSAYVGLSKEVSLAGLATKAFTAIQVACTSVINFAKDSVIAFMEVETVAAVRTQLLAGATAALTAVQNLLGISAAASAIKQNILTASIIATDLAAKALSLTMTVLGGVLVFGAIAAGVAALVALATSLRDAYQAWQDGKSMWDFFLQQKSEEELDWLSRAVRSWIPDWAKWSREVEKAADNFDDLTKAFEDQVAAQNKQIAFLTDFAGRIDKMPEAIRKMALQSLVRQVNELTDAGREVPPMLADIVAAFNRTEDAIAKAKAAMATVSDEMRDAAFNADVNRIKTAELNSTLKDHALAALRQGLTTEQTSKLLKEHYDVTEQDELALKKLFETYERGAKPQKEFQESIRSLTATLDLARKAGMGFGDYLRRFGDEAIKVVDSSTLVAGRTKLLTEEIKKLASEASKVKLKEMYADFDISIIDRTRQQLDQLVQREQAKLAKESPKSMEAFTKEIKDRLFELTTARMGWYDREMAIINKQREDEIKSLGPVPAIYTKLYTEITDAKLAALKVEQAATEAQRAKELEQRLKAIDYLKAVPDAYASAYDRVVLEVNEKYNQMSESSQDRVNQEIVDLGPVPEAYADAYNKAADAVEESAQRQKDALNGVNINFNEEARKRNVMLKDQLQKQLDTEVAFLNALKQNNLATNEDILAQEKRVFELRARLRGTLGIETKEALTAEAAFQRAKLAEMLKDRDSYTQEAIKRQYEVVKGAEKAAEGEVDALDAVHASLAALSDAFETMANIAGDSFDAVTQGIGNVISGANAAIVSFKQLKEVISSFKDAGSGSGGGGVGGIVDMVAGMMSFVGAIGAAVAGAIKLGKALHDAFTRSEAEKAAADIRRNFGFDKDEIDENSQVSQDIEALIKKMKIDRNTAIELLLPDIIKEAGGLNNQNYEKFRDRAGELFDDVKKGGAVGEKALKSLDETMAALAAHVQEQGGIWDEQFIQMLQQAQADGLKLKSVIELINGELAKVGTATKSLVSGATTNFSKAFDDIFKTVDSQAAGYQKRLAQVNKDIDALAPKYQELFDTGRMSESEETAAIVNQYEKLQAERVALVGNIENARKTGTNFLGLTSQQASEAVKAYDAVTNQMKALTEARSKLKDTGAGGPDEAEIRRIDEAWDALNKQRQDMQPTVDRIKAANAEIRANYQQEFDRISRITLASFNSFTKNGKTAVEAAKELDGAIDQLADAAEQFGFEGGDAYNQLVRWRNLVEQNAPLLEQVGSFNELLMALNNTGSLTAETFNDIQAEAGQAFQQMIDNGFSEQEALAQLKPTLETIRDLHEEKGMAIDETTKKLIVQAEAEGILAKKQMSVQQVLQDGLGALIKVLGGELPKAWQKAADGAEDGVDRMQESLDGLKRQLDSTDWTSWARDLGGAASDAEYDVNGLAVGHSPGGVKDVTLELRKAQRAAGEFATDWKKQMADAKRAVEAIDVESLEMSKTPAMDLESVIAAENKRRQAEQDRTVYQTTINQHNNIEALDSDGVRKAWHKTIGPEMLEYMKRSGSARTVLSNVLNGATV